MRAHHWRAISRPRVAEPIRHPGTGAAINGNLPYYSNFLADGASAVMAASSNFETTIFEAISEVQINTPSFSAQYGIGGVVFNQISKSGTNNWHGSAYEYFRNDALNARDFFEPSELLYS